jgi:hypothetical protein
MSSVITEAFVTSWRLAPFPLLLLYLFLLGAVWLFVEFQITRVFRHTPGWRRAGPILPQVSLIFFWVMRISRTIFWLWLILFLALFSSQLADQLIYGYRTQLSAGVIIIASYWRTGYEMVTGLLPEIVRQVLPGV